MFRSHFLLVLIPYKCGLSWTLKLRRGAFTMINEKHDGILNGPRVLLLRDKFNKSLIIFKIDARIFIYTENEYLDNSAFLQMLHLKDF